MTRQCPSCGGFCKKSGCERENAPIITSSDVIASLQMALSQAEAMIERQQHVIQRAMAAWDTATHQKSGDGRLLQCMEELRAESHNADLTGAEGMVMQQEKTMELETVNKLYLELSQFATAETKNDLELETPLS